MKIETNSSPPRPLTEWEKTFITPEKYEEIRAWAANKADEIIRRSSFGSIISEERKPLASSPRPEPLTSERDNFPPPRLLTEQEKTYLTPERAEEIRREAIQQVEIFLSSNRLTLADFVVNPMANVIMNFLNLPFSY